MAKIEIPVQVNIPVEDVVEYLKKDGTLVEVVRCRDCKHWNPNGIGICKLHDIRPTPLMMDDWFCADGERKDDD